MLVQGGNRPRRDLVLISISLGILARWYSDFVWIHQEGSHHLSGADPAMIIIYIALKASQSLCVAVFVYATGYQHIVPNEELRQTCIRAFRDGFIYETVIGLANQ
jgi:hypothetical protein